MKDRPKFLRQSGLLLKGILAGAYIGYVLGYYICDLTSGYVIQNIDYTHSFYFEKAQERFRSMMVLSFVVVFAFIGPFVAAATFGRWMRHAVYGFVTCLVLVVICALVGAAKMNENPFHDRKRGNSKHTCIDAARYYGIPASLLVGPIAGIIIGGYRDKRRGSESTEPTDKET